MQTRTQTGLPAGRQESIFVVRVVPIEHHSLMGTGIGYVDAYLLASAQLDGVALWTLDRRFQRVARRLGLLYLPQ